MIIYMTLLFKKKFDFFIIITFINIMLFITPYMIEPATASIAVYLLTKTSKIKPLILKRRPFHYKKKICKWIIKNKDTIIDVTADELADYLFDISNNIHIPYPTLSIIIYWMVVLIFMFL